VQRREKMETRAKTQHEEKVAQKTVFQKTSKKQRSKTPPKGEPPKDTATDKGGRLPIFGKKSGGEGWAIDEEKGKSPNTRSSEQMNVESNRPNHQRKKGAVPSPIHTVLQPTQKSPATETEKPVTG